MHRFFVFLTVLAVPSILQAADGEPKFSADDLEFFEKSVRPVLAEHCFECHSAKSDEIEASLRVDFRGGLLKGGETGPAVVPGSPAESRLVKAISYADVDLQMPPDSKLSASKIAALTRWIQRGAAWPKEAVPRAGDTHSFDLDQRRAGHWCWQPVRDPDAPEVGNSDWVSRPLDAFILSRLEAAGLDPAAEADRRTLIRRAYFDLIGLPPEPEEVAAFLADDSPRAFRKVVDGLLDSPHFGERWARHWMDLMRYAESHGHEFDYPIHHAWKYRDYLIRALNADVPFDSFITEHIAGDLLKQPRLNPETGVNESVIGTGFWWLGEATHAPVDVRADEAGRIDNQIDVMSKAFLGLTVACARCHDHKFDAIATQDYYALAGFLQSSRKNIALLDPQGKITAAAADIRKLRSQGETILKGSLEQNLSGEMVARYLLAAREVIYGQPAAGETQPAGRASVVFEDFEQATYVGWKVEGTAFGAGPQSQQTTPGYQGDIQAQGRRWVNSHNVRGGARDVKRGDDQLGRLTSRPFAVRHKSISFLVGGGSHKGRTCVNLRIDGKVVRSQTGFDSNQMRPVSFDVADLLGQTAQIEIVDQQKGSWGNIGVDQIVFQDPPPKTARSVRVVAQETNVDAAMLERWVDALLDEKVSLTAHPMFLWMHLAPGAVDKQAIDKQRQRVLQEGQRAAEQAQTHPGLTDFSEGLPGWFADGHAFDAAPTNAGDWDWRAGETALSQPGLVRSHSNSRKLQGVLRSPTFKLDHRSIFVRMRGEGIKARLILDGYYMYEFNGLLFRGFQFDVKNGSQFQWYQFGGDVSRYTGHTAYIEIIDHGDGWAEIDEIRFSDSGAPAVQPSPLTAFILQTEKLQSRAELADAYGRAWSSREHRAELGHWLSSNRLIPLNSQQTDRLKQLRNRIQVLADGIPAPDHVLALTDGTGENERVFIRGNHKSPGPIAPRQLLTAIDPQQSAIQAGSGRLELARRIASGRNPLTSRVAVNRVWHHLFGRGIVASTDNFGVLGQRPTHPLLLDHLASQFVRDGWSVKKLLRNVMLSSTYRMSSGPVSAAQSVDPENALLHRQRIRRLQGETIRDAILAVSGRLDRRQFGPGIPVFITSFMNGRGRPRGGPLDGAGRRSVYLSIRRNFLSPMMLAFDMPIPFNPVGRRNVSNVPSQALILMNDPFVNEQSRVWARALVRSPVSSIDERVRRMYQTAFSTPPDDTQLTLARSFLREQAREYGIAEDAVLKDERIWADFGHVLFNTKPFIYLY